jgi:hypothetical protein
VAGHGRARTLDAVKRLLLRESQVRPLLLIVNGIILLVLGLLQWRRRA